MCTTQNQKVNNKVVLADASVVNNQEKIILKSNFTIDESIVLKDLAHYTYHNMGLCPIPETIVETNGKFDKVPLIKDWNDKTTRFHSIGWRNANSYVKQKTQMLSILTGSPLEGKDLGYPGVGVIDIDLGHDGLATWNKLLEKYGDIDTYITTSGSGGKHYYFIWEDWMEKVKYGDGLWGCKGLEWKNKIILAGKSHKGWYKGNKEFSYQNIVKCPEWIKIELLKRVEEPKVVKEMSFSMYDEEVDESDDTYDDVVVEKVMEKYGKTFKFLEVKETGKGRFYSFSRLESTHCELCNRVHDKAGIYAWKSGGKVYVKCFRNGEKGKCVTIELGKTREDDYIICLFTEKFKRGDIGMAELFLSQTSDCVITGLKGEWIYIWNKKTKLWEQLTGDFTHKLILDTLHPIVLKVIDDHESTIAELKENDPNRARLEYLVQKYTKLYDTMGDSNKIHKIYKELKPMIYDKAFLNKLDNSPYNFDYFPFEDKVVHLPTGQLMERKKEHYFTKTVNCLPDSDPTKLKIVDDFIRSMSKGEDAKEMHKVRQLMLGQLLSGDRSVVKEFYIMMGETNSMKSTFNYLAAKIMGGFAGVAVDDIIVKCGKKSAGGASPHLTDLYGKRYVYFNELDPDTRINEAQLKSLVSDKDPVKARGLNEGYIEFINNACLGITTNHFPKITTTDKALRGRIKVIPCRGNVVDKIEDPEYDVVGNPKLLNDIVDKDKLLPSLIHWAILGSKQWYTNGKKIKFPVTCEHYLNSLIAEQDYVLQFFDECIEKTDNPEDRLSQSLIYPCFEVYYKDTGCTDRKPTRTTVLERFRTHFKLGKAKPSKIEGVRKDTYDGFRIRK